jgi:cell wall-associated NlpC family hydrolase
MRSHLYGALWTTLLLLVAVGLSGCGSTPPQRIDLTSPDSAPLSDRRAQVVRTAQSQLGAPYRYGGNGPSGFDCSGLVEFTHRQAGVAVPRTAATQWQHANTLDRTYLLPGDLVFFSLGSRKPRQVGIYTGGGEFIHAPSSGGVVSRASLDDPYWRSNWLGSRSFL